MITQERLSELLSYEPDTGIFRWRVMRRSFGGRVKPGAIAGTPHPKGYTRIRLDQRNYYAHRLAWFYVHGSFPKEIDHINGDRTDNRIANLRSCTRTQNNANSKIRRNSASGFKGVSWNTQHQKWMAILTKHSKRFHLGFYDTPEDAHKAYCEAAREHFEDFMRAK